MKIDDAPGIHARWPDVLREQIESTFGLGKDYALLISDLERMQIIEPRRDLSLPFSSGAGMSAVEFDELVPLIVDRWNSRVKYDSIGFPSLGIRFVEACSFPKVCLTATETLCP